MIAVDTNVIIRHLTRDDPKQAARAHQLMIAGGVFVSRTVMLETEWVLRSAYGYTRDQIATAFDWMLASEGIMIECHDQASCALAAFKAGLDFADALHIASCPTEQFATFDRALKKQAVNAFPKPDVITP